MASPLLFIDAASVHYEGTAALSGLTCTVEPGERVALLGRSGAGKSTLLRLINATVQPSVGSIEVFGQDLGTVGEKQLRRIRRDIGLIAQGLDLPKSLRVVHNVNAGRLGQWSLARALLSLLWPQELATVRAALAAVQLDGFEFRRTDELSGGQQQRVAVARAIVQKPRLILADEPIANLDPELARVIIAALLELCGNNNALVVSLHQPEIAREFCTRAICLLDGEIAFDGPIDDIDDRLLNGIYQSTSP